MDTSGQSAASIILDLVMLVLLGQVVVRLIREWHLRLTVPWLAIVLGALIGIPSLLQFAVPSVGRALMRDPTLEVHRSQWWRVLTAIAAQDGGLVAAIFNLIVVLAVVAAGQWLWGWWRTAVLFVLPSIVVNVLAVAWDASGGGSSFASDALALSIAGLALVRSRQPVSRVLAGAMIAIGVALVAINDAHGVAMLIGAVLGIAAAVVRYPVPH